MPFSIVLAMFTAMSGRAESVPQTIARASACFRKIDFIDDVPRVKSTREEIGLTDAKIRTFAQMPDNEKKAKAYAEKAEDFFERWSQNTFTQLGDGQPELAPDQMKQISEVARDPNCFAFLNREGKYTARVLKEALRAGPLPVTRARPTGDGSPSTGR